jgi:Tfp pilus assembly protein FimT
MFKFTMYVLKTKKTWFTLIEMLFVIILLGILFLLWQSFFNPRNQDLLYAQTCINWLIGQTRNFVENALLGKAIYLNETFVFPETYIVSINQDTNLITFSVINNETESVIQTLSLTGNSYGAKCSSSLYQIIFWGTGITKLTIQQTTTKETNYQLTHDEKTLFTKNIPLQLIYPNSSLPGKNIYQILIDKRIKLLKLIKCLLIDEEGQCQLRSS